MNAIAVLLLATAAASAAEFQVTNLNDSGPGTLRQAISDANQNTGPDNIRIVATGTLRPLTELPALLDQSGGTTIIGNAGFLIQGDRTPVLTSGLVLLSAANALFGLAIAEFPANGILLRGAAAHGNTIQGCLIGADGQVSRGNNAHGIAITSGASGTAIGGAADWAGNTIAGNGKAGILISGAETTGNTVFGNRIGTDKTGAIPLGNGTDGILIEAGGHDNIIGAGTAPSNIISANNGSGVRITGVGSSGNIVAANYIGTDYSGMQGLGNVGDGIVLLDEANGNQIGAKVPGGNLISGNFDDGIQLYTVMETRVIGNWIGIDAVGLSAIPNQDKGLVVAFEANFNQIGGNEPGEGNVISGNIIRGVEVANASSGNVLKGNYIGTDPSAKTAIPNFGGGLLLRFGAFGNLVGGPEPGAGNIISGNGGVGLGIWEDSNTNRVSGNLIGVQGDAESLLGNETHGVEIKGGSNRNVIGGETAAEGNVIAGNGDTGIYLEGGGTRRNSMLSNSIYQNGRQGIQIQPGSQEGILPPVISRLVPVTGTAIPNALVQIYLD